MNAMKYVFFLLTVLSAGAAALTGKGGELTEAILNSPCEAVELCIYLCGGMCFWGGLMRIAEKSGLTAWTAAAFSPVIGRLLPALDKNGRAFRAVCMNITANLLGMGNAATPLGIEAIKAMKEEEHTGDTASRSMIMFTLMNTASITLIPSNALSLRIKYGSAAPAEIMPAVWLTSAAALAVSLTAGLLIKGGKEP